jgi:hypothetical protein
MCVITLYSNMLLHVFNVTRMSKFSLNLVSVYYTNREETWCMRN